MKFNINKNLSIKKENKIINDENYNSHQHTSTINHIKKIIIIY